MKKEYSAGFLIFGTQITDHLPERFYLLLKYPKGYWDFAKGKLEADETLLEAAFREVKEETGLTVDLVEGFKGDIKYLFSSPKGELIDKTVTYFIGYSSSQRVTLSDEHTDFCWLPYREALKKLTYKNAQKMLTQVEHFLQKQSI